MRRYLILVPLIAWLAVFVLVPTLLLVVYSLCQRDAFGRVEYSFTLGNYRQAFEPLYARILWRSLIYAVVTTLACILIGYPVAYLIGRSPQRQRDWLILLVMLPFWTSFVIRTYAWITILSEHGVLNGVLQALRLTSNPISILYTPAAIVLGLVYTYLPFMILPIYTSVEQLDQRLLEAAADLGAGPLQTFWRVTLPLTRSGIAAGVVLTLIPAVGMFAVSSLLGGARESMIGDVIEREVVGAGRNLPFGAALSVLLTLLFLIAVGLFGRRAKLA